MYRERSHEAGSCVIIPLLRAHLGAVSLKSQPACGTLIRGNRMADVIMLK
mgnify:CR=1 FL=1